jgi:hypothetical protein
LVTGAAEITLAWDANDEATLTGYRVYYGTRSRVYHSSIDVGNATSCAVSNLKNGTVYFFAATAVDSYGLESDYSNEVTVAFGPDGTPSVPGPSGSSPPAGGQETTAPTGDTGTVPGGTGSIPADTGSIPADTGSVPGETASVVAASGSGGGGGGGGGGGCFIATAAYGSYFDPHVMILRSFRDTYLLTNDTGRAFVRWYYAVSPSIADTIRQKPLLKALVRMSLLPAILFGYLSLVTGLLPAIAILLFGCFGLVAATRSCRPFFTRRVPPGDR